MSRPIGLDTAPPMHETKQRLILAGLEMMLERGYHAVGIQDLLTATSVPKGSFYHHFESKEDFALQVVDAYQANVHALLQITLTNQQRAPLDRIRDFFDGVRVSYAAEGYLGCFLGALGQELSGASDVFRQKIESCLAEIASSIRGCLEEAGRWGDIAASTDADETANLIVNAWEGAALRSRLTRDSHPFDTVLNFYFAAMTTR